MLTILITGIHGFLGSSLAKKLAGANKVIGLGNNTENTGRLLGQNFKIYSSKQDNPEQIFIDNQVDVVIHAATVYRNNNSVVNMLKTNIELPVKLYELACKYNARLFINTDSFFNDPKADYSYLADYTLSKKHSLEWLKCIRKNVGLINMKIFHMYGPGDGSEKFVSYIITGLKNNVSHIDLTEGNQARDFIFIEDTVDAYSKVIDNYEKFETGYHHLDVGTGKLTTIKELILLAKDITQSSTVLNFGKLSYRQGEIMSAVANNEALIQLGWQNNFSVKDGLLKTIQA